jgi:hypothetical protein
MPLASSLGLRALDKDQILEWHFDLLGTGNSTWRTGLSRASDEVLFRAAHALRAQFLCRSGAESLCPLPLVRRPLRLWTCPANSLTSSVDATRRWPRVASWSGRVILDTSTTVSRLRRSCLVSTGSPRSTRSAWERVLPQTRLSNWSVAATVAAVAAINSSDSQR